MKYTYLLILLLISSVGFSQTKGITYQAVILNPIETELPGVNQTNAPLANSAVCLKFGILDQNSVIEYLETIQTTTDKFGMVNLIIGTGSQIGGYASTFSDVAWDNNAKNLQVHLNAKGNCSSYIEISNQPFTYVPFALNALNENKKLIDGTIFLGDANGDAQEVTISGDVTMDNAGVTAIGASKVVSSMILDGAVTTDKLLDANVTNAKLATGIDANKLANGTVTNAELQYIGTLSSDAQNQITTNAAGITTNASNITTNTADIATNASGVTNNASNIATNTTDIASNASGITTNASDITTNTTDIASNASGITTNASDITTNTTDIASNASGITTNTSGITTNASNITTNTTDIASNASDITTNASDITTNASGITTNASNITTNATDIKALETLADGNIYIGNSSNVAEEVKMTGDVTIDNTGATTIGTTNRSSRKKGDILYWNGTAWTSIAVGTNGAVLQLISGAPTWVSSPDITGPTITINGSANMNVVVGGTFTDSGATTNEGTLSTSGTVNVNTVGTYILTYSATDTTGNTSTATRTVNVYKSQFSYTGSAQTFTVPAGVTSISVDAYGGSGYYATIATGRGNKQIRGGKRGRVEADLTVTPGDVLYIYVGGEGSTSSSWNGIGGGGYNGGGRAMGGYGGGGATHIATVPGLLSALKDSAVEDIDGDGNYTEKSGNPVLIVAGAGGAGPDFRYTTVGGAGGGKTGANGGQGTSGGKAIQLTGGTQVKGGYGHSATRNGKFGKGGDAYSSGGSAYKANGGGAGWFGGGGGWYETMAGAGGSSYTHPVLCSEVIHTQGDGYNNGQLIITIP